jgi:hypothetical protein
VVQFLELALERRACRAGGPAIGLAQGFSFGHVAQQAQTASYHFDFALRVELLLELDHQPELFGGRVMLDLVFDLIPGA